MDTNYKKGKTITTPDGTTMVTFDSKLHNWDGPALIPEGNIKKGKYFIYGIEYSHKEWKIRIKQREGLPFYKQPGTKART